VALIVIQRQLGRSNLGITSIYRQGIDNAEIIETVPPAAPRWFESTHRSGSDRKRIASAARRAKRHRSSRDRHRFLAWKAATSGGCRWLVAHRWVVWVV
jgi:hypothetical protein